MGFFFQESITGNKSRGTTEKIIPIEHLNTLKCVVCPLDKLKTSEVKVKPAGSKNPIIYLLGESPPPGREEELPFSDETGRILLNLFPKNWYPKHIRVGHITQCATANIPGVPAKKELQIKTALECCRFIAEADIEQSQPQVIIGLGETALRWAVQQKDISAWRGRLIPIKIGNWKCWFYPISSPSFIKDNRRRGKPSEFDLLYQKDIEFLVDLIQKNSFPEIIFEEEDPNKGVVCITGKNRGDFEKLTKFWSDLEKASELGFDIETTDLRPYHNHSKILSMALSDGNRTVAFAWDHPEAGWTKSQKASLTDLFKEFLFKSKTKFAHNLNMELEWISHFFGKDLIDDCSWGDTMGQAYLLDTRKGVLNLDALVLINFGLHLKSLSNLNTTKCIEYPLIGYGNSKTALLPYNALDAKYCIRLAKVQRQHLASEGIPEEPYIRFVRVVKSLVKMQSIGLILDDKRVTKFNEELGTQIEEVEDEIRSQSIIREYATKFGTFNPGSTHHLLKLFNNLLKRPEIRIGEDKFSTGESQLSAMPVQEVPVASMILKYRNLTKQKSTYIDSMQKLVYPDGRLHSKYGNSFAATGRLNSDSPNGQNFPKRKNKEIREIIIPPSGYAIVAADYGQIEARVIGMLSKDEAFCESIWTGYDIHMDWAIRAAKLHPELVGGVKGLEDPVKMKKLRNEIKNLFVFPSFFGSTAPSIARNLGMPTEKGEKLQGEFWKTFAGAKLWQKKLLEFYAKNGYVETPTGRRFRGPLKPTEIFNFPVQGTAADIMQEACCNLTDDNVLVGIQIHDDATSFCKIESLEQDIERIAQIMCTPNFDWINVPLSVEVSVGMENWGNMEDVGVFNSSSYGFPSKANSFARPKFL